MSKLFDEIAYPLPGVRYGLLKGAFLYLLYILSLLYGSITHLRLWLYSMGLLGTKRLDCKVISVGNLTVGGTGKTPFTEFISRRLLEKGYRVAILSRGYGRNGKGIGVVTDGEQILLGPEESGDEPYMLATRLKKVPVLVGSDRYELGRYAVERFSPDLVILDDGYQHIRLERDIDIVLVDGRKGFGNGHQLPRGPLREPVDSVGRADIVVINKAADNTEGLIDAIARHNPRAAFFKTTYRAERIVPLQGQESMAPEGLKGKKVAVFSGIASPASFVEMIKGLGADLVWNKSFPDHYDYTKSEIMDLSAEWTKRGAQMILMTEKDAVKVTRLNVSTELPAYYLEISLHVEGQEEGLTDRIVSGISV